MKFHDPGIDGLPGSLDLLLGAPPIVEFVILGHLLPPHSREESPILWDSTTDAGEPAAFGNSTLQPDRPICGDASNAAMQQRLTEQSVSCNAG
jgi:hypothetical protein